MIRFSQLTVITKSRVYIIHPFRFINWPPKHTDRTSSLKFLVIGALFQLLPLLTFAQEINYLPSSTGELIHHMHYSLSYVEEHEQPEWVAYYLSPEKLQRVVKRKDSFKPDPKVSTGSATYADYKAAKEYDAGHLLPCRQMQFDCEAMSETFYMSNMSPQHWQFNQQKWSFLEKLERNMAYRNAGIYVITGPVLTSIQGKIGIANKISIPNYYYKIFLKYTEEEKKAIAFLLPNRKESTPFQEYVVSVDSLEELTGLDFFPGLPDDIEGQLELFSDQALWSFKNPNDNYGYALESTKCTGTRQASPAPYVMKKVNINTARINELESLPGIGTTKARAIIDARPYQSPSDITKAKGIGQSTLERIKDRITVH